MPDKKKSLTRKQQVFVAEYLKCWNASEAARRAGYSEKTAYNIGWENVRKPEIQAEIQARLDEVHLSSEEAIKLLSDIARGDLGDFMTVSPLGFSISLTETDEDGQWRKKSNTRLIKKIKQKTTTIIGKKASDDDKEIHETEIELHDPQAAIEKILRVQGKFKDVGSPDNPAKVIFEIVRKEIPNSPANPPRETTGVSNQSGETQGDSSGQARRENDGS